MRPGGFAITCSWPRLMIAQHRELRSSPQRWKAWPRANSDGSGDWGLLKMSLFLRCRGYVNGQHSDLPIIALTTINRRPVSLHFYKIALFQLNSLTPFSIFPYFITSRTYCVGAALIGYSNMLFNFQLLEKVFVPFLDGLPTVDRSPIGHKKPVFR